MRPLTAAIAVGIAAPAAMAAPDPAATAGTASAPATAEQLIAKAEAADRRAESSDQALRQREALDEAKQSLRDDASLYFQVVCALFGVLITGIVVFFSLRANNEAKAEARNVARDEIKATRDEFDRLHTSVDQQVTKIREALARVQEIEATMAASAKNTQEIEQAAIRANKALEGALKQATDTRNPTLSDTQRTALQAAAEENKETAQSRWTRNQFMAAINKALFMDSDWIRAAELARDLAANHDSDEEARRFALASLARAELEQKQFERALGTYDELIQVFLSANEPDAPEYCDAIYHRGLALNELGRFDEAEAAVRELLSNHEKTGDIRPGLLISSKYLFAHAIAQQGRPEEAEAMLRDLLPKSVALFGKDGLQPLNIRHEIAQSVLEQGRSEEARKLLVKLLPDRQRVDGDEHIYTVMVHRDIARSFLDEGNTAKAAKALRDLVPVCERVLGHDSTLTLTVRCAYADSQVRAGDAAGASTTLAPIPDPVPNPDWLPRWTAAVAFVRGEVADGLGEADVARTHLARAKEILARLYPADHFRRRQFDAYLAQRPNTGESDA